MKQQPVRKHKKFDYLSQMYQVNEIEVIPKNI